MKLLWFKLLTIYLYARNDNIKDMGNIIDLIYHINCIVVPYFKDFGL